MESAVRSDEQLQVVAAEINRDNRKQVIKHGNTFTVTDLYGDIQSEGEHGVFHNGTRYLSSLVLRVEERRPTLLNSSVKQDNSLFVIDLSNPEIIRNEAGNIPRDSLHIFRSKVVWEGSSHDFFRFMNYGNTTIEFQISIEFDADFSDIFEVRGFKRKAKGKKLQAEVQGKRIQLSYMGLDQKKRYTRLTFNRNPLTANERSAKFNFRLAPHKETSLHLAVECDPKEDTPQSHEKALEAARTAATLARSRDCRIKSSNEQFNNWLERSSADLHMLITETPYGLYPYAGIPWFSAPFGRDGIITALQYLWVNPDVARGVLEFLAAEQADSENKEQEAEPGKILHEMRKGELAALGEIPFNKYYGSVDATPLFVMLAGAYYDRTGDRTFIQSLWPNIEQALNWIDRYGDRDGDGFIEYVQKTERGLNNQGWKDSDDAISHVDGSLAHGSIALCEVQAYVYAAWNYGAELANVVGKEEKANELRQKAKSIQENFNRAFWSDEISSYSLALDGQKHPCNVKTSNAGHALFTQIADKAQAQKVVATLMHDTMFSGWGIRTLALNERRYNPMSYHNGSVWPHDNSLIAMGFAHYGFKKEALQLLNGLFEASHLMSLHRLPELFCGFRRRIGQTPTSYPFACSPQAWASASVFYLLQACLGLTFNHEKPNIKFSYPALPEYIEQLEIHNLRVADGSVDLLLRRHETHVSVNVLRKEGDIEVAIVM